jgi:hypothetical protein
VGISQGTLVMLKHSIIQNLLTTTMDSSSPRPKPARKDHSRSHCFYIDKARRKVREPDERAGWRVVSFGRRDQNIFLVRLIAEMVQHQAVMSNSVTTAIWYAAHLGRRVRVFGSRSEELSDAKFDCDEISPIFRPQVFEDGVQGDVALALADDELGFPSMLSPTALNDVLRLSPWRQPLAGSVRLAIHGGKWRHGD